jgi:HTH-type transcriptional regulator/antitoxin HigA
MTVNVDKTKYGQLLTQTLPAAISNDEELELMTEQVDRLMTKGIRNGDLSPEEETLLELLSVLIEKYEDEHYPIPDADPVDVLRFFMEDRGVKQADLLLVFGSSGIASEVVNGKRSISKAQAKKLAEFFKVSVELFI